MKSATQDSISEVVAKYATAATAARSRSGPQIFVAPAVLMLGRNAVLRGLRDALAPRAALDIFPLHEMPPYNEDDDGEHAPESVRALRSAIEASDGVIMISPEYNHGMSGVLKNALDWASRPYGRSR